MNLLKKLFEKEYGCEVTNESPRLADSKAPEAPENKSKKEEKPADDSDGDNYMDDDFDMDEDDKSDKGDVAAKKADKQNNLDNFDDDWDMDGDDLGEVDQKKAQAKEEPKSGSVNVKDIADKKRRDIFFGAGTNDLDDLEELEMIGGKDFDNNNEDKFNQVLSTSKENGGLLASIGLKKGDGDESLGDESQEEDPHKKSDLFDTSKDRGNKDADDKN